jgi:hypothetical protein
MTRPPLFPDQSAAGIAVDPRTLERVIPESKRLDGSYVALYTSCNPGLIISHQMISSVNSSSVCASSSKSGLDSHHRKMYLVFVDRASRRWMPLHFPRATYSAGSHLLLPHSLKLKQLRHRPIRTRKSAPMHELRKLRRRQQPSKITGMMRKKRKVKRQPM